MLTKKQFIKAIDNIKEINNKLDKLRKVNSTLCSAIVEFSLQDALIAVIEQDMNLPTEGNGSTLSWWIYDNRLGKNDLIVKVGNKAFDIKTAGNLYDYLIKYEVKK